MSLMASLNLCPPPPLILPHPTHPSPPPQPPLILPHSTPPFSTPSDVLRLLLAREVSAGDRPDLRPQPLRGLPVRPGVPRLLQAWEPWGGGEQHPGQHLHRRPGQRHSTGSETLMHHMRHYARVYGSRRREKTSHEAHANTHPRETHATACVGFLLRALLQTWNAWRISQRSLGNNWLSSLMHWVTPLRDLTKIQTFVNCSLPSGGNTGTYILTLYCLSVQPQKRYLTIQTPQNLTTCAKVMCFVQCIK